MLLASGVVMFWAWREKKVDPTPRCATCGYNLTGNVSGICPECGTPIPEVMRSVIATIRTPIRQQPWNEE